MLFDGVLREAQTQSRAGHSLRSSLRSSIERFKDALPLGLWNSRAMVPHANLHSVVYRGCGNADPFSIRPMSNRIADQVAENESHGIPVAPDNGQCRGDG